MAINVNTQAGGNFPHPRQLQKALLLSNAHISVRSPSPAYNHRLLPNYLPPHFCRCLLFLLLHHSLILAQEFYDLSLPCDCCLHTICVFASPCNYTISFILFLSSWHCCIWTSVLSHLSMPFGSFTCLLESGLGELTFLSKSQTHNFTYIYRISASTLIFKFSMLHWIWDLSVALKPPCCWYIYRIKIYI